jgi:hypothetical protein
MSFLYLPVFICFFVSSLRPRKLWLREGKKAGPVAWLSIGPALAHLDCASAVPVLAATAKDGNGEGN